MSTRWNYIKIFTRLSSLISSKFNLLVCTFDRNNIAVSDMMIATASSAADRVNKCIHLDLSDDGRAMSMIESAVSKEFPDRQAYPCIFISASATITMFIDIVTEDVNTRTLNGGFVFISSTPISGRVSVPTRSKFTVTSDILAEDFHVIYVIRNDRSVVKMVLQTEDEKWFNLLSRQIRSIIESVFLLPDMPQQSHAMVTRISSDPSWTAIFTHVSHNPNPQFNYETMETLGDKVMSLVFVNRLVNEEQNGNIDPNLITDIHKEILSRNKQNIMGQHLGFHKLIRSGVQIDEAIIEDVVEAFFGNLFTVTNRLTNSKFGFLVCQHVFNLILKNSFPDLNIFEIKKDPQTVLDQMFQKLGWGHPEFEYDKSACRSTITLSPEALTGISRMDVSTRVHGNIIGYSEGINKKDAEKKACVIAIDCLKKTWGIDQKYIRSAVKERLLADPRYTEAYTKALRKATASGFTDIYVQRKAKNRTQYYIVTGIRSDESESNLFSYHCDEWNKSEGNLDSQINALNTYLRHEQNVYCHRV